MSYIVRAGNLAGPVKLTQNTDGTHHGRVTVIVNDRAKDPETGKWETVATTGYYLRVHGQTAVKLKDFQELNGNAAIIFTGTYHARTYTSQDGQERVAHDVWVDHIGADIALQELHISTHNSTNN